MIELSLSDLKALVVVVLASAVLCSDPLIKGSLKNTSKIETGDSTWLYKGQVDTT
jgi:hypothetical protein